MRLNYTANAHPSPMLAMNGEAVRAAPLFLHRAGVPDPCVEPLFGHLLNLRYNFRQRFK